MIHQVVDYECHPFGGPFDGVLVKTAGSIGQEMRLYRLVAVHGIECFGVPDSEHRIGLLAGTVLLTLALAQRRRFEREKAELTQEHLKKEAQQRQRAEQTEQELVRVQNEKLEAEVQHKNEELALATMHLVQKGEMLASIQEALERVLQREHSTHELRNELRRVLRLLQLDTRTDQDWEQFAVHFDQVYGDFLKRLREHFPQLSPNDYRLCAYLRMNLNTKEIAHLLNISVRGVEGSRYRLRRKLNLDNDENLVDFLMGV